MSSGYDTPIVPHEEVTRFTVVKAQITNVQVVLDNSASCSVYLFDADNNIRAVKQSGLNTEQYPLWGSNDNYFVTTVLSNIGLTSADGFTVVTN